jgi:PAS domain S-box-containing protein
MKHKEIKVLLIEDNKFDQMAFERLVKHENLPYVYSVAASKSEAEKILGHERFDVIIADYFLGDGTLFEILDLIQNTPIIVATGVGAEEIAIQAMKEGAYDYLIKDQDRNYLKVLPATVENALKHKKAEERYQMLSHAVMSINDSVYITDMNDKIIFVNKVFCKTYGYREKDILGKPSKLLWKEESINDEVKDILSTINEYGWKSELYHKRKDGSEFPISLSRSVIKDDNGNEIAVVGVAHDITERKRTEEELQKAKEAAESAARAKTEFLTNVSHEIRTPLNAIIGMTELVLDTGLTSEQQEYLKVVQTSSEALLSLIDDILNFSKIETAQMELEEVNFNLTEVIEKVADIFSVRAAAKGLELLCYVEPDVPAWVIGDPTRLRQILINLVDNAVKFTEQGDVAIKVSRLKSAHAVDGKKDTVGVHFMISDTGVGVSTEQRARIFDKFYQADNTVTRRFDGTGLGLSMCKSLVEMMGGRVWLESEVGRGSTFHFSLNFPIGEGKDKDSIDFSYLDFEEQSILVVDDNDANRLILLKTLSAWGFQVSEAASGTEALSLLRDSKIKVDLVILDHQMPGMSGVEVARAIRREAEFKNIKIIILSSRGGLESKLLQELDITKSITKPVKQSKLFEMLKLALPVNGQCGTKYTQSDQTTRRKGQKRILLVEDNADNQTLTKRILEKAGYRVEIAANGQLAVEAAKSFLYDLILMDVQMPVLDGLKATKQIRDLERRKQAGRVPIIALTAHAIQGYREKCLECDMDDYVTKPLKKKILLEKVLQWTEPMVNQPCGR